MASGQPPGTDPLKPWNQSNAPLTPEQREEQMRKLTHLSEEEKQVMKECERDSFYQRALPLSVGCMLGAHMLVKSGRWNAHPRFGSLPKAAIFGGMGYFIGKMSYLSVCQQKILDKIPNSNLAAAIRKSRGLPELDSQQPVMDESLGRSQSSNKLKDDYTALEGLDDRHRPSIERDTYQKKEAAPEEKPFTSYEELRRRNRQDYEDSQAKRPPPKPGAPSYKDSPHMPQRPWPEPKDRSAPGGGLGDIDSSSDYSPPPSPPQAPPTRKRTNMWGDPIE